MLFRSACGTFFRFPPTERKYPTHIHLDEIDRSQARRTLSLRIGCANLPRREEQYEHFYHNHKTTRRLVDWLDRRDSRGHVRPLVSVRGVQPAVPLAWARMAPPPAVGLEPWRDRRLP